MTKEEKEKLIGHLTAELPALRGTVKVTQDDVANAIGQTKTEIWQDEPKINWRAEDIFQNTSDSSKIRISRYSSVKNQSIQWMPRVKP